MQSWFVYCSDIVINCVLLLSIIVDDTSSGIGSETVSDDITSLCLSSLKKKKHTANHTNNSTERKKKKLCNVYANITEDDEDISIFESTLDLINTSDTFKDKVSTEKHHEFDAFASYIGSCENPNISTGSLHTLTVKGSSDMSSQQLFDTQILKQFDMDISKKIENDVKLNLHSEVEGLDELPLMQSFVERMKSKQNVNETVHDQGIAERSILFEDDKVTMQYRQEVDNLFNELEQTVFSMGLQTDNKTIPDDLLDVIFNEDLKYQCTGDFKIEDKIKQAVEHINESVNSSSFNKSFGIIKQALINNAGRPVTCNKDLDALQITTISQMKSEFQNLGPFYGLPYKVKELILQYKGIEELYGKEVSNTQFMVSVLKTFLRTNKIC